MVVLRKKLVVEKGQLWLFEPDRYFFYITNDRTTPASEIVFLANDRCDQENLIAQLKGGRQGAGDAGGRPGEQLGVHGDGIAGVEPEGVERPGAARAGPVGGEVPGGEAVAAADGVQHVLRGDDPGALPDRAGQPGGSSTGCCRGTRGRVCSSGWWSGCTVAGCVEPVGDLKPESGCSGPCWLRTDERRCA